MLWVLWILLGALPAAGNGQSTHLWITDHALTHVQNEALARLLHRDDLRPMLRNGTMFPDGGYAVGDPYGELAHWEQFQDAYRVYIEDTYDTPFTDEGAMHVAFLMGLASHGMADQVFDALFMERSKQYDTWGEGLTGSLDGASDVLLVHATAPQTAPEVWVPEELFEDLFQQAHAHEVSAQTMARGQILLGAAIQWVTSASQDPEQIRDYRNNYPWASQHLLDDTMPGAPPCEGEIIAGYWEHLWELLNNEATPEPRVLATMPENGARAHHPLMQDVESRITVVFSNSLDQERLDPSLFHVMGRDKTEIPIQPYLFYRDDSNVVHLALEEDLAWNTKYTVTVDPGLMTKDGYTRATPIEFSFRTSKDPNAGCGACMSVSGPMHSVWLALLFCPVVLRQRLPKSEHNG